MEDRSSLLQGTMQEDSFDVVMRGYDKRQVQQYVDQCQRHIHDLAQRLALAEHEIERIRADASVAIEKAAAKPVHEEVSERLAQILRLASEEAERERANAADEIAALKSQALAETQNLREQAHAETEALRRQVIAETEAMRDHVRAEADALRQRVEAETEALRDDAEQEVAEERERARAEADRVLGEARAFAEQDVAQARAEAQDLEDTARSESERLMLAARERADSVIGEAERRADAINVVLGGRLESLTTTHSDVVTRLAELRTVLVDVLGREESQGPFAVPPSPSDVALAAAVDPAPVTTDPYVQTAGEVAAAYEASGRTPQAARGGWGAPLEDDDEPVVVSLDGASLDGTSLDVTSQHEVDEVDEVDEAPAVPDRDDRAAASRRLDLSATAERTRH